MFKPTSKQLVMRGKGHKRAAEKAFKQWQKLHFNTLCNARVMPAPLHATLRLPVFAGSTSAPPATPATSTSEVSSPAVDIRLSTNHRDVAAWWESEYRPFLHIDRTEKEEEGAALAAPVIAATQIKAHVGPPASPLGYPSYLAAEAQAWTEGVLRGETYAYEHLGDHAPAAAAVATAGAPAVPPPPPDAPYLSPVRWLRQPLLDGFVAQRLTAHAGVTTGALIDARRRAAALGRQLPPVDLSPFIGASELLDAWCLFGEPAAVLPAVPSSGPVPPSTVTEDAAGHHRRVTDLAAASAILPNYSAAWLNGAVVANPRTGRCVFLVGPRASGKTTLALHCVAPDHEAASRDTDETFAVKHSGDALQLVAAEHFFLAAGTPVRRMLRAPAHAATGHACPQVFTCAVPHRVKVGVGAVLGTLRPNPALTAAVQLPAYLQSQAGLRAFLANTDAAIWDMSLHWHVPLQHASPPPRHRTSPWQPAGVNALAGVVLLDWDVGELASTATAAAPVRTRVRRLPLHAGGLQELLTRGRDFLFRGHYLVRSAYDDADGATRLAAIFEDEWAAHGLTAAASAPALHCLEGSVDFDAATQLVKRLLTS